MRTAEGGHIVLLVSFPFSSENSSSYPDGNSVSISHIHTITENPSPVKRPARRKRMRWKVILVDASGQRRATGGVIDVDL